MALVEIRQRQIAPDGREGRIDAGALFPEFHRPLILPAVIHQAAQIIRRIAVFRILRNGGFQNRDVFKAVREAVQRIRLRRFAEQLPAQFRIILRSIQGPVVIQHRVLLSAQQQRLDGVLPEAGIRIVQRAFDEI